MDEQRVSETIANVESDDILLSQILFLCLTRDEPLRALVDLYRAEPKPATGSPELQRLLWLLQHEVQTHARAAVHIRYAQELLALRDAPPGTRQ